MIRQRPKSEEVMVTRFELTEQNYRYLFDNATDAMWVHDMDGNILVANKASEKLTGYTHEELADINIVKFLTADLLNMAREVKRKLLKGEAIAQPYEQRLVCKDGTMRVVEMSTSLVVINGQVTGFQNIARDVTEEKSVREMLSKIINGSPLPSFVVNKWHEVTHWNTAMESLSGISGLDVIGKDNQWQAFYTEKRPTMADLIVDGASADEVEVYYQGKYKKSNLIDGAYEAEDFFPALGERGRWLHFTASPLKDENGEIIGAIETLEDVTEEKQMQENLHFYVQHITRAQEDERKRIARELHDDVAPPLLLLIQRLDSATSHTRPKLTNALKETLEDLRVQAIGALEGVRRCAQQLRPPILDDLGLIPALEWITEDLVKNYGISAHVEVVGKAVDLSDDVQLLLFRIAQEAVSNVRKHSGASKATVRLEFGDKEIEMTVSDNGKGFEIPSQSGAFVENGRLGITGMYERSRLLGGNLRIQSELGRGTEVVAEVPLRG